MSALAVPFPFIHDFTDSLSDTEFIDDPDILSLSSYVTGVSRLYTRPLSMDHKVHTTDNNGHFDMVPKFHTDLNEKWSLF